MLLLALGPVAVLWMPARAEAGIRNPGFEEGSVGWDNVETGDFEYFAPVDGERYAKLAGRSEYASQRLGTTIESGKEYTVTVWTRSLLRDAYLEDLLDPSGNWPSGTSAQAEAEVQLYSRAGTLASARVDVQPKPLQGAPADVPADDGCNVWIDGNYRVALVGDFSFYQHVSDDPIHDPWSEVRHPDGPEGMAVGQIITSQGLKALYVTDYEEPDFSEIRMSRASGSPPDYNWSPAEGILANYTDEDPWVLDAHLFQDNASQRLFLSWGGQPFRVTELDPESGRIAGDPASPLFDEHPPGTHIPVANWSGDEWTDGNGWFEGPALYKQGGYWYLFGSYGNLSLNYTIRMGRGTSPTGPFYDKRGRNLNEFDPIGQEYGNSFLLGDDGNQVVPGHPHVWEENGKHYIGYDYRNRKSVEDTEPDYNGIRRIYFEDGWPTIWTPVEVHFRADDHPEAIGQRLGVRFRNRGQPDSLLGVDHVTLQVNKTNDFAVNEPHLSIRRNDSDSFLLHLRTSRTAKQTQIRSEANLALPFIQWPVWWTVKGNAVAQDIPFPASRVDDGLFFRAVEVESLRPLGNVWCVGDSWTDCWEGTTWRRYLWQDLQAEDWMVEFVGTNLDGPNCEAGQSYDRDHDGYAGITAETVLEEMDAVLDAIEPDTLLLLIGGNDIETTPDSGVIMERIRGIVEKARLKNPRLFIHLGMYGYVDGKFADASLDTFADRLQALATSLHSTDSPVAFVDHRIGWVKATDLDTDLFHPSPAGMEKIAANWLRSLRAHHY